MKCKSLIFPNPRFFLFFAIALLFNLSCSSDDPISQPEINGQEEPSQPDIETGDKLPLITINTNTNTIVDEPKVDAQMTITENDTIVYDGAIAIEFRGASSQSFPKKSYGLETRDGNNEDLKVSLLGFPEEEDWILYGPYSDKSLIRNRLIYDLSRDMDRYASRSRFVELNLNDSYQGVYVFMEKLKRDSGRIDINNLEDDENSGEDLTGGYILKIDKIAGSNVGEGYHEGISILSNYAPPNAVGGQSIYFLYDDPKAEEITAEQKAYISGYMAKFEDALASNDFADADLGYAAYIDADSFIDFFLLNELANNVDGYRLSTFMHKEKNEKLKMGPIWDFNLAFGNADYCDGGETDVWAYQFNERCPEDFWQVPFWWGRLLQDPAFVARLKARWIALRAGVLAESAITSKIDAYTMSLDKAGAIEANFETWPVLGMYVWPNNFIGQTYSEETDFLKKWISDRLIWMDDAINSL